MVKLGFNVVSLANNYTMDKGIAGVLHSVKFWKNKNIYAVGSYGSESERKRPLIKYKNGISYVVFAYTGISNLKIPADKPYLLNFFNKEKAREDIEQVRSIVDIVIVSLHWGLEYQHTLSEAQQELANYLAALGVDIIIGHHPHVIQPIQVIKNTLVIYSLGNFLSSQPT